MRNTIRRTFSIFAKQNLFLGKINIKDVNIWLYFVNFGVLLVFLANETSFLY